MSMSTGRMNDTPRWLLILAAGVGDGAVEEAGNQAM